MNLSESELPELEKELNEIRSEMFKDFQSYPSFYVYTGRRPYNDYWPRNEILK